jgi:flagellin-like hook-associated protein FlgL
MSLINEISGRMLKVLAESSGSTGGGFSSTLGGKGTGSTVDQDSTSLSAGLRLGAQIFTNSVLRLNDSINLLRFTQSYLEELSGITKEIIDLTEQAANLSTSQTERQQLNEVFKRKISQFRKIQNDAKVESTDLFAKPDIRAILIESGIDINAATKLAQAFHKIGGRDNILGYEKVSVQDQSIVDPLRLDISTVKDAEFTKEAFLHLEKELNQDLRLTQTIVYELDSAQRFASISADIFREASALNLNIKDAEKVAIDIVGRIKSQISSAMLGAHSGLDTQLARDILSAK